MFEKWTGVSMEWLALRAWQPACRVCILRCEQLVGYRRRNLFLTDKFGLTTGRSTRLFNSVLEQGGYAPVKNSRELFAGDLIVIPGVPQLDPLDERAPEFYPTSTCEHVEGGRRVRDNARLCGIRASARASHGVRSNAGM